MYNFTRSWRFCRCGKLGHFGRDPKCPARGKTCHKCGAADHFGSECKTKNKAPKPKRVEKLKGQSELWYVECDEDEEESAFIVHTVIPPEKIDANVGGVVVAMLIDSGASANVIDRNLWSRLKQQRTKCVSQKSDKKLCAYGSKQPLKVF